jgi:hypothetical protein
VTVAARVRDAWARFWFASIAPHSYAVLRITLGLSGCALLMTRSDVSALWDPSAFVPSGGSFAVLKQWLLTRELGALAGTTLFAGSLCAFAAMTVGLWSRVSVPLCFMAALVQVRWNSLPLTGADEVLRTMLFCLMWADTGAVWSVDAWRRRELRREAPSASIAALRLMRFQLALVYLSAGLFKIDSLEWRDGSAVYYVLNSNVHQRVPYFVPASLEWLTTLATYLTLGWELAFAPLILFRRTRTLALILGACIHLGMFAFMEVGPFHLVMLASYPAFLAPETIARLAARRRSADRSVARGYGSVIAPHDPRS